MFNTNVKYTEQSYRIILYYALLQPLFYMNGWNKQLFMNKQIRKVQNNLDNKNVMLTFALAIKQWYLGRAVR